jgi:hypothetical protein
MPIIHWCVSDNIFFDLLSGLYRKTKFNHIYFSITGYEIERPNLVTIRPFRQILLFNLCT